MGCLRTLLAISVLITHSSPILGVTLLGGDPAVICFFVISGFLITLILREKYQDLKAFYVNRALRIYVPYWTALALSLALFLVIAYPSHDPDQTYLRALQAGDIAWVVWSTISNLTLVGIDLLRYVTVEPDLAIAFPSFLHDGVGGGQNMLFVPQAWTLAIELQFYLVAPLLVRLRLPLLAGITVGLLIARTLIFQRLREAGLPLDDSAIFPMMLAYFLLGALAYHGYRWWRAVGLRRSAKQWISAAVLAFGFVLVFAAQHVLRERPREEYDLLYLAIAAVLPFAFYLTSRWRWDQRVGDYSYPIYVFHFGVAALVGSLAGGGAPSGLLVLLATVALSAAFLRYVDAPVQRVRQRIAARTSRPDPYPAQVIV